jgi:hypothetical protein
MIDLHSGRFAYAVLSFGGFLKMGKVVGYAVGGIEKSIPSTRCLSYC